MLGKRGKEEPSPIAKALNHVKNTISQFTSSIKKKDDSEEVASKDGIVTYRGMKMTVAQRQEYQEMEED
jgi:hypothetical protein